MFPVIYEVRVNKVDPGTVEIQYRLPSGKMATESLHGEVWATPTLEFALGTHLRLSARAKGDPESLVQCTITTRAENDPDGTVHASRGGASCQVRAIAGRNPLEGS
jgi:hypothetical protein